MLLLKSRLTIKQAQEEYNVKKLKEFKFNTPEGKPVTLKFK